VKQEFYSNGKLLLTGEYVVLDGALGLAIPTSYGQSLIAKPSKRRGIQWKSNDKDGTTWFQHNFRLQQAILEDDSVADPVVKVLITILREAQKMNPSFLHEQQGWEVTTHMNFQRDWGLGSSSTLINNIAQWAQVDAFKLLQRSFGGSGYDIAAAQQNNPFLYAILNDVPSVVSQEISWNFTSYLFFVHLNKKQNSKEGINRYKNVLKGKEQAIIEISEITKKTANCTTLDELTSLIERHESCISSLISLPTIKEQLFTDYPGSIKSLGAWGGDFILATGGASNKAYFRQKGYSTIIAFAEMIK